MGAALLGAPTAVAETFYVPMIAVACQFPAPARASGYDCAAASGKAHGGVELDDRMSSTEITLIMQEEFRRIAAVANDRCGRDTCRFFFGVEGKQCLAIAQSPTFTGLGSFLGKEQSREDAEHTALVDCQRHVGTPGAACTIIESECTSDDDQ